MAKFAGAKNIGEMTALRTPAHFATPRNGNGSKTLAEGAGAGELRPRFLV